MTALDRDRHAAGPIRAIYDSVVFLTRLPAPAWRDPGERSLAASMWAFPLGGVLVAIVADVVYALCAELVFDPLVSALIAIGAGIIASGGLHEDGLSDYADGIWGGHDPADRLAIMSDSRIGTFGAVALILSIGLRAAALAAIGQPLLVLGALVAAAAVSRAMMPAVMAFLDPAKQTGLGATAGTPGFRVWTGGVLLAAVIAIFAAPAGWLSCLVAAAAGAAITAWYAQRKLGGYTGDVLGAVQQVAEVFALALIAAAVTEPG